MGDLTRLDNSLTLDSVTLEHIYTVRVVQQDMRGIELKLEVADPMANKSFWMRWLGRLRVIMSDPCTVCLYAVQSVFGHNDGSFVVQARLAVRLASSDKRAPSTKSNLNLLADSCSREVTFTRL